MSYIGRAPGFGIRNRYYYTATASQTTFSGADDNGQTLAYADSKYLDVYLNGVLLVAGTDYTATTLTSVSLTSGAAASDIVEIVAYDIFSVADTVSAKNGGTFDGAVTVDSTLTASGLVTAQDGLTVDNDGATVATFDRATSDGTIIDLQKDGSSFGSIGVGNSLDLYLGTSDTGIATLSSDNVVPWNPSTNSSRDDAIDLGSSSVNWKDLYLSGGVYLGGTGSANKLDDYEEGSGSLEVADATTGGNVSPSSGSYDYVKIGKIVQIRANIENINTSGLTSGNVAYIRGFPFAGDGDQRSGDLFLQFLNVESGTYGVELRLQGTYAFLNMYKDSGGGESVTVSDFSSGTTDIRFNITYITTA